DRQLRDDVVIAGPELVLEVVHRAPGGKIDEEAARVLRSVAELLVVAAVDRAVEARVARGTGLRSRLIAAGRRRVPVRPALVGARGGGGVVGVVAGVCSLELPRPLETHSRVPAGGVVAGEVVIELGGDVPLAAVAERNVVVVELIGVLEPDDRLGDTVVDLGVRPDLPRTVVDADAPPALDRKSTRLNSSHVSISYAVFCLKKKKLTARNPENTTFRMSALPSQSLFAPEHI